MASGRKSKISVTPKAKPDISVSSSIYRSKPIALSQSTTRGNQSSRSIVESILPLSRSKAISRLSTPSSPSRSKSKTIEVSTPQSPIRFFSKKSMVGGSSQQVPHSSRGIEHTLPRSSVGQLRSFPPRRPLTHSEL